MIFVEYIRGGGPRYVYGENFDSEQMKNIQGFMQVNQPLMLHYKDFVSLKKLRRMQLRIIAGIEMFYGNFKRFKFFFAIKELPELAELMSLSQKISTMQMQDAHTLLEQGKGMQAVDELLQEAAKLEQRKKELLSIISEEKKSILDLYSISISELKEL